MAFLTLARTIFCILLFQISFLLHYGQSNSEWFGVSDRLGSSSRYVKFADGVASLSFCLREFEEETTFYIPNTHRYRIKPGKIVYLAQYYFGKLLLGDEDLFEETNQILEIRNIKNESMTEFEINWNSCEESMTSSETPASSFTYSRNSFQKKLNQVLDKFSISNSSTPELFPTNTTILAFPQKDSQFHYLNQLEISSEEGSSPYATFLSTLTNSQPAVPSVFNEISKQWNIFTSRKVGISTSFALYFNRFIVHLTNNPKPTSSLESSNLNEGFISDIIYGNVFRVEINFETEAKELDLIHDFFSYLYDHSSKLFHMAGLMEIKNLPACCQIEFNCTIFEREKTTTNFSNFTLITLFQHFKKLNLEIHARSLRAALPIAVQVRSPFHLDSPVSFSFTHVVSNQLPPVSILLLVSNILMTGSILGLTIASFMLVAIAFFLFGAVLAKLQEQGRISLPRIFQIIPIRIHLVAPRFPQFRRNEHQD